MLNRIGFYEKKNYAHFNVKFLFCQLHAHNFNSACPKNNPFIRLLVYLFTLTVSTKVMGKLRPRDRKHLEKLFNLA